MDGVADELGEVDNSAHAVGAVPDKWVECGGEYDLMRVDAVGECHAVMLRGVGVGADGGYLAHLQHLKRRLDFPHQLPVCDRPHPARRQLRHDLY